MNIKKCKDVTVVSVRWCLRFVTSTLCAATFGNSYVKWRLRYVMLRFVAVPCHIKVQKVTAYKLNLFYAENLTWEKDWHYNLSLSNKANWKYQKG